MYLLDDSLNILLDVLFSLLDDLVGELLDVFVSCWVIRWMIYWVYCFLCWIICWVLCWMFLFSLGDLSVALVFFCFCFDKCEFLRGQPGAPTLIKKVYPFHN